MLLKAQRNELLSALLGAGLDPNLFAEKSAVSSYRLTLKSTADLKESQQVYFFVTDSAYARSQKLGIQARPGFYNSFRYYRGSFDIWEQVSMAFGEWARNVKSELETPDLWADLQANARLLGPTREALEEVFTPDEARQLRIQLQHVQQQLLMSGLPEAAARQLAQTVQEAGTKAERFTKKEWQAMFIGSMISAMTSLAMTPDNVKVVYQILKTTFTGLFLH